MLIEDSWDSCFTLEPEGSGVSPALTIAHLNCAEGKSGCVANYRAREVLPRKVKDLEAGRQRQ